MEPDIIPIQAHPIGETVAPTQQICPECGQPYDDGERCWICVARNADIEETIWLFACVAGAGWIVTLMAVTGPYPPLTEDAWVGWLIVSLFFVPFAILWVLYAYGRVTRYAVATRLMFALFAAALVVTGAYFFLNGALDDHPHVTVQANVTRKEIGYGDGPAYLLVLNLSWNGKQIKEDIGVSSQIFSAVEPGDSVRVVVHPGALSTPWYGEGLFSSDFDKVRLNSR